MIAGWISNTHSPVLFTHICKHFFRNAFNSEENKTKQWKAGRIINKKTKGEWKSEQQDTSNQKDTVP